MINKQVNQIPDGYKLTEVGVIPNNWEFDSLGLICVYQNGTSLEKYFNNSDGYKVISIGNYSTSGNYIDNETFISKLFTSSVKKFILDQNDLTMILNDKTSTGEIIGRVLLVEKNEQYVFNQRTMRLTTKGNVLPKYLYFLINSDVVHKQIIRLAKPGTQIYVNTNDITELAVAYPKSTTEQTTIVAVLSEISTLIEKLELLIKKKKNIKQGAMQELLTGKRRLPGFSDKWEKKKLGELLEYEQPTKYLVKNEEYDENNNTPVLTAGKTFILGFTKETKGIFNNLPVIIFDDFTTATKYVNFPFKAKSSAMKMLKPRTKNVNLRLVFEKIQMIDFKLKDHKRYWISEYQNQEVSMPKPNEQTAISSVLADIDLEIKLLEKNLEKYKQIKQGTMQVLLTGKIRLINN